MYTLKSSFKPGQCLHSAEQNTQLPSSESDKERKSVLAHRNVNLHIHPYLHSKNRWTTGEANQDLDQDQDQV